MDISVATDSRSCFKCELLIITADLDDSRKMGCIQNAGEIAPCTPTIIARLNMKVSGKEDSY